MTDHLHDQPTTRQYLIFDADDTLWENNVYFERATAEFIAFVDHADLSPAEVRAIFDEVEIANRSIYGYGARAFARNLRDAFAKLSHSDPTGEQLDYVERLGLRILEQEFEVIDGVPETLDALSVHHDIYLLTKGHTEEQQLKIDRSGLEHLFDASIIAHEKSASTYTNVIDSFGLDPTLTWMIGNSPRSDVNPALQAGINAIFIPHPETWSLEIEEIVKPDYAPGRLIQLQRFRDLLDHFGQPEVGS